MTSASLSYCIHNTLDSGDEMTVLEDAAWAGGGQQDKTGFPPPVPPSSPCVRPPTPTLLVTNSDDDRAAAAIHKIGTNNRKKRRTKAERSQQSLTLRPRPGSSEDDDVDNPDPVPPPPALVVQVMPPTPTTPTNSFPGSKRAGSLKRDRPVLPLLCLPVINLPGDDDDEEEKENDDSSSEPEGESAATVIHVPQCEIRIEDDSPLAAAAEDLLQSDSAAAAPSEGGEVKQKSGKHRGRKRRRSLVNLLFPKSGSQQEQEATTPTLEAPQGQRLHFRRVSEIFSKMGSSSGKDSADSNHIAMVADLSGAKSELSSPVQTPVETCGLSIRNLFPYRRRRSSVHHMDNTDQFKENREEVMLCQRRRMSSFPPMDGDEAAIMLEKANVVRLERVHQQALDMQSGNSMTNAFRRLRRGSRSPSPRSLLPGVLSKKQKWKSSTDVSGLVTCESALVNKSKPVWVAPTELPDFPDVPFVPPPSSSDIGTDSGPTSFSPPTQRPSLTCHTAPVVTNVVITSDSAVALQQPTRPLTPQTASGSFDLHRPHFIFPKRRLEDVPGIFIPKTSAAKTTEDALDIVSGSRNLLAVMKDRPRRHSMSDSVQLTKEATSHSRPMLLPRSPYSTDCATGYPPGSVQIPKLLHEIPWAKLHTIL